MSFLSFFNGKKPCDLEMSELEKKIKSGKASHREAVSFNARKKRSLTEQIKNGFDKVVSTLEKDPKETP